MTVFMCVYVSLFVLLCVCLKDSRRTLLSLRHSLSLVLVVFEVFFQSEFSFGCSVFNIFRRKKGCSFMCFKEEMSQCLLQLLRLMHLLYLRSSRWTSAALKICLSNYFVH